MTEPHVRNWFGHEFTVAPSHANSRKHARGKKLIYEERRSYPILPQIRASSRNNVVNRNALKASIHNVLRFRLSYTNQTHRLE